MILVPNIFALPRNDAPPAFTAYRVGWWVCEATSEAIHTPPFIETYIGLRLETSDVEVAKAFLALRYSDLESVWSACRPLAELIR